MKPILIDFPEKIESERLYIRPCMPGDGHLVYEAIQASLNELQQWLPFAHHSQTLEEVEEGVRKSYAQFILKEDIRLHIFRKEDHQFIGSTGLHRINWEAGCFEIGYWCDSRFTKKGYITESTTSLIKTVFEDLQANRVEIRCDPDNIASRSIPEKLGFTLEATLKNNSKSADGKTLRDTCVFSKLKK
ncbi:GNAT family N-acetyltransferase [Robertmurraya beringensis]|jgi:RimJ/RimL family protein N-acetyltransferase|uniref:GNAT family N-acetyltransferase n=1 Tax=Robertmurraya beringensis TaxID=641660 RepID=A0ABV6KWP8_9BACI|nr:Putative acetyltransferase [Mycobacteroides abscessus subsp. abscessus]